VEPADTILVSMALGGETGSRLAARLATLVSPADPPRLVRRLPAPAVEAGSTPIW